MELCKDDFLEDLKGFFCILSVCDDSKKIEDVLFGLDVKCVFDYMIEFGKKDGFIVKEVGNVVGYFEYG